MVRDTTATERISYWRDFRKTSLQQFARSGGDPAKHVLLLLDSRDDVCEKLIAYCYDSALKDPHSPPHLAEDLGVLQIIGAPFVLILPLSTARAAFSGLFPKAAEAILTTPPPGEVRIAIVQDNGNGAGCTVITDAIPRRPRASN